MSVARRQSLMTADEFLAWEEGQELRHEFDGFQPLAMTGGTVGHALIQRNLFRSIDSRLRGKPCRFYGGDLKVETSRGYRYPDGFVACTPVSPRDTAIKEPVVIFEVLSASTASVDRFVKSQEYAAIASVKRYVMLEQDRVAAIVFEKAGDDWVGHILLEDATLSMPEIDVELPLLELYEDLDVTPEG